MNGSSQSVHSESFYVPVIAVTYATLRYSLQKLPVANVLSPQKACGFAQRIGYTGRQDEDLAIYRLKIKRNEKVTTITLPGLYVIEDGIFVDYEQWCQKCKSNQARNS